MAVTKQITSPEAAATLARGRGTQYLGPYFDQPTSMAQAAATLGQPMANVHYWTRRWHDLGLLEVAATKARAGRPVRLYRTTADVFEVPPELLPATLHERQLRQANRDLVTAFETTVPDVALGGLLRVHKDPTRRHVSTTRDWAPTAARRRPDVFHVQFTASLTAHQAAQLRGELTGILKRWTQRSDDTADDTHLVTLALIPLQPGR